jgi:hypothetical protein
LPALRQRLTVCLPVNGSPRRLGEINDSQSLAWRKSVEAFLEDQPDGHASTLSLFPDDRVASPISEKSF